VYNVEDEKDVIMERNFILDLETLSQFVEHSSLDLLEEILIKVQDHLSSDDSFSKKIHSLIHKIHAHLIIEERELFSKIQSGSITESFLEELRGDHGQILADLEEIRELAQEKISGDEEFLMDLNEMDRIINNHVHLEDNLLFPMILNRNFH